MQVLRLPPYPITITYDVPNAYADYLLVIEGPGFTEIEEEVTSNANKKVSYVLDDDYVKYDGSYTLTIYEAESGSGADIVVQDGLEIYRPYADPNDLATTATEIAEYKKQEFLARSIIDAVLEEGFYYKKKTIEYVGLGTDYAPINYRSHKVLKKTKEPYMIGEEEIESLPRHCFMNIEVVNQKNELVSQGRDLNLLKGSAKPQVHVKKNDKTKAVERFNLKRWDFDELPHAIELNTHQKDYKGFVGLSDEVESVAIRVFVSEEEAKVSHRHGVLRLLSFELKPQLKQLEKDLNNLKEAQLF